MTGPDLILLIALIAVASFTAGVLLSDWAPNARAYNRGRADQYAECRRSGHHGPVALTALIEATRPCPDTAGALTAMWARPTNHAPTEMDRLHERGDW